ncbi:hypothetical protein ANAEL_00329 [Anaerolineales bacterium]|nr:hypothetical protein ANAEL_00329 [Anaerolineales bacterium]
MKDFFKIRKIRGLAKKKWLVVLFALFIFVGVGVSAYFGSDSPDVETWSLSIAHAPSTPTPTLVPDIGWWSQVATPTASQ